MGKTNWTIDQTKAINLEGKNILVSAGAGSGKTAVLTERLIRKLKNGISLRNLIVLTFTKAAAFEMKERLRWKIKSELLKGENEHLREELAYIDQSNIQTFDSFSLFLVKKYNYLLKVDKNITIGDNSILSLEKKKIIDEVFLEEYQRGNVKFLEFIKKFTIKNDESIKILILDLDGKLDLLVDKEQLIKSYFKKYYTQDIVNRNIDEYVKIIKDEINIIKMRVDTLLNEITDEALYNLVCEMNDTLKPLFESSTYEDIVENLDISFSQIPRKVDNLDEKEKVSAYKTIISDFLKKIREKCIYSSSEEMKNDISSIQESIVVICDLLKKIDSRISQFKKEHNMYEFIDVAKMAIKLMKENENIRNTYRYSINEILVDEYQDTSDVQEELINLIGNNNIYMVGDIKQSIYRFRNANPDIFKEKYVNYKENIGGEVIDLSQNFRSRTEVLNNVNEIFSRIMNLNIGGADYNKGHSLVFGNSIYLKFKKQNNNMKIISYTVDEKNKADPKEIEGRIIASDILEKMESGYEVYDRSLDAMRKARFDDFAVLTSDKASYDIFKKVFDSYNIPLIVHQDSPYIDSIEIVTIRNLLKCVYSFNDEEFYKNNFDYSFLSLLRSFLVDTNDDAIFSYFVNKTNEFNDIIEKIKEIAAYSRVNTLGETLEYVYQKFSVYNRCVLLSKVEDVENRLNYLLNKAYDLSSMGYSLCNFIEYLEYMASSDKVDMEFSSNQTFRKNVCNLLTIHKSKGLEYNICYFPCLTTKFNLKELKERIIFDNHLGIIAPYFNEGIREPFYKEILKYNTRLEEISERIRLFYVALTRAKDKIILVTPALKKALSNGDAVADYDKLAYTSFYDLLSSVSNKLQPYITEKYIYPFKKTKEKEINNIISEGKEKIIIDEVSLKRKELVKVSASIDEIKLFSKEEQNKLNYGTLIHSYFEKVNSVGDIEKLDVNDRTKETLKRFFSFDIFKDDIINRYHEYEFAYVKDGKNYHGFIDLLLETNDKFIIVDYKLKNIDKEEYHNQLKVYYEFLESITDKKIEAYLYSIIDNMWKKIEDF